jgi:hypothetical protein
MEATMEPTTTKRTEPTPALDERLETWVSEGVITRGQAEAIADFEAGRRPARRAPGITPVAEGLAYLGGALALAAGGTALGGTWDGIPVGGHIAIVAALWLGLLVAGWRFRDGPSPALVRLSRVLWLLSAAALAWAALLVADEGLQLGDRPIRLASGAAMTVYSVVLYLARPNTLQQLAIATGVFLLAIGFAADAPTATGFAVWVLGIAWIVLGWRRVLLDPAAAATIGSLLVLLGTIFVGVGHEDVGAWMAVASSAGLIGAGVAIRRTAVMVIGTVALFFSTFATIERYVQGTTGIAIGLLVAGAVVSAVALGVWRRGRAPAAVAS